MPDAAALIIIFLAFCQVRRVWPTVLMTNVRECFTVGCTGLCIEALEIADVPDGLFVSGTW